MALGGLELGAQFGKKVSESVSSHPLRRQGRKGVAILKFFT